MFNSCYEFCWHKAMGTALSQLNISEIDSSLRDEIKMKSGLQFN